MTRFLLWMALPFFLVACGTTAEPKWAPDDEIAQVAYRHPGPSTVALYTVVNSRSGSGAHSALLINGTQRLMFDPAGTWWNPAIPERNDVHYGINPHVLDFYEDYHTRETYHTVVQTIEVSPEVAAHLLNAVQSYGAVPKAMCSRSISTILSTTPGFESIKVSWFPNQTMAAFGAIPGVVSRTLYDTDADDNSSVLAGQNQPAG